MLKVNEKKCVRCYKCLSVCPFTVLEKKENGVPGLVQGKTCLQCMHCASICPVKAYENDGEPAVMDQRIDLLNKEFKEDLVKHIMRRRSIRHFTNEPVDKDVIMKVLDIASWAPSAKNQHPTKYIVVTSKDTINKMMEIILDYVKKTGISPEVVTEYESGNNVVMGEASTLLIAYARDNAVNPPGDTYISMTTAELLFQSQGIGTCWCGYLTRFLNAIPELKELLPQIPEGNSFYASFMMGYPKDEEYIHIPIRVKSADINWVE